MRWLNTFITFMLLKSRNGTLSATMKAGRKSNPMPENLPPIIRGDSHQSVIGGHFGVERVGRFDVLISVSLPEDGAGLAVRMIVGANSAVRRITAVYRFPKISVFPGFGAESFSFPGTLDLIRRNLISIR
jgi:hypothetical protein